MKNRVIVALLALGLMSAAHAEVVVDGVLGDWESAQYTEVRSGVGYAGGSYVLSESPEGYVKTVLTGPVNPATSESTEVVMYGYAKAGDGIYIGAAMLSDTRNRESYGSNPWDTDATIPYLGVSFGLTNPDVDDVNWRVTLEAQARISDVQLPDYTSIWYKYGVSDDDPATVETSGGGAGCDDHWSSSYTYDANCGFIWFQPDAEMMVVLDANEQVISTGSHFGFPSGISTVSSWEPTEHYRIIEYHVPWSSFQDAIDFSVSGCLSQGETSTPDLANLCGENVEYGIWHQRAFLNYDWTHYAMASSEAQMYAPIVCDDNGGGGEDEVILCHYPPGEPDNPQSISVPASAVDAHLAHGDYLGECVEGGAPSALVVDNGDFVDVNEAPEPEPAPKSGDAPPPDDGEDEVEED